MLARLLKGFTRDEGGAFAVIFGLMAIVLVAMTGAVVDYVSVDQVRNQAQIALDSAALALQPKIYTDDATTLLGLAKPLLVDSLANTRADIAMEVSDVSFNTDNGELRLAASLSVPMAFVTLVGVNSMTVRVVSQVTRKKINLEVAMVLDNSGSMSSYSRMTNLKSAAKCATNILFYDTCNPTGSETKNTNTKIGVVPFTIFVNVGASNASAAWMDQTGASSISPENFDDDDNEGTSYAGPVNRFDLYNEMNNVSWKGCVEGRPYPYSVDDTPPNVFDPDTLFVPEFAPDEPDSGFYNSYIDDDGACNSFGTCSRSGSQRHGYTYTLTWPDGSRVSGSYGVCSCSWGGYPCSYSTLSNRERQERLCKYENTWINPYIAGPNANCPDTAILPLTDDPNAVTSEINAMVADGGTNIHDGVIWGFRVLSPTEPFTQGRDYDTGTAKVMIMMTDGENTYYQSSNMNQTSVYYPFGYLWNVQQNVDRLGTTSLYSTNDVENRMNALTVESCLNAKEAGITIYTVGLSSPNNTTRNMLINCASSSDMAYFPNDPSELNTVFATIAGQLAQLRIEK